jgi:hypothetical protein
MMKSLLGSLPKFMLQGAAFYGMGEGLEAIIDAADGDEEPAASAQSQGQLLYEIARIEQVVQETMANTSAVLATVLEHHDKLRAAAEAKLLSERREQLEERRRVEAERNETTAAIARQVAEILAQQQSSTRILLKAEKTLSDNPIMAQNRELWKRSPEDQWEQVAGEMLEGYGTLAAALEKISPQQSERERREVVGEAAALIGGVSQIQARFAEILGQNVSPRCHYFMRGERKKIIFASVMIASVSGMVIGMLLTMLGWKFGELALRRKP